MRANVAFWDTSAIVPLCCAQEFSFSARRIRSQFNDPVIWWGTPVEVHSGFDRLDREGILTANESTKAIRAWKQFYLGARGVKPDNDLLDLAISLPAAYNLRAMDAFQLASALRWCGERPRNRPFVCADKRLGDAASAAGFEVVSLA